MLNYSFPSELVAKGMIHLAAGINNQQDDLLFKDVKLPELPPRNIETILALAETGLASEVSVLEWISLLNEKDEWDSKHVELERASNALIWQIACKNHGLRYLLYWRFVMHLDGIEISFPKGLTRQFGDNQRSLIKADKQRTSIVASIKSGESAELCKQSLKLKVSPTLTLKKFGLPNQLKIAQQALKDIPRYWVDHEDEFEIGSLFGLIDKLKAEEKDTLFSALLVNFSEFMLNRNKDLVSGILKLYSPHVEGSRFKKLSDSAQDIVRGLIGAMSFSDFSKLIAKLTELSVAEKIGLDERDIRQLNSRVAFWSNYQAKFVGFSVFLPSSTYHLLKQLNFQIDGMSLYQLNDTACEICILEFENNFVMEFLRGSVSGLRVIDKGIIDVPSFKNGNIFTTQKQLESIPYIAEHDHLIFWQNACEKMLRTKFNLTPPKHIKKFLITQRDKKGNQFYQDYSSSTGLPKLTNIQMFEREQLLTRYRSKAYGDQSDTAEIRQQSIDFAKSIIESFSADKKIGGWFGYSQNFGWLVEVGGSERGLLLESLAKGSKITVSHYELKSSLYLKVSDYLNSIQSIGELQRACESLISVIDRIPIESIKCSLEKIVKESNYTSGEHKNNTFDPKRKYLSEAELLAIVSSQGGVHVNNRHKGGVLKIVLQKSDSQLKTMLLNAGFKELNDNPLAFWKR